MTKRLTSVLLYRYITPSVFSPLVWNLLIFKEPALCLLIADEEFAESTGRLELFDLCEGKRLWEKRMPRAYQIYNGEYNNGTER